MPAPMIATVPRGGAAHLAMVGEMVVARRAARSGRRSIMANC
jgi:hypothetical protein